MRLRTLLVLIVGLMLASGRLALAAESEPAVVATPPKAYTQGSAPFDEGRVRQQLLFGFARTKEAFVRVQFQYGLTTAYGRIAYGFEHPYGWWNGHSGEEVEGATGRLRPDTTYHYRLVAWNEAGKSLGEDRKFHTRPRKPSSHH